MSVGLILSKIGHYLSIVPTLQQEVDDVQTGLQNTDPKDKGAMEALGIRLSRAKYKLQLAQEFLNFWKDQLTAAIAIIKSLQEIGQGVR